VSLVWTYGDTVSAERASSLRLARPFTETVKAIFDESIVLCAHFVKADDADGYYRYVFTLKVPLELFDYFFNSEHGYRGAYFSSPFFGLEANQQVINTLTPKLLKMASDDAEASRIYESLSSPSAKIWLTEREKHLCNECQGEWSPNQSSRQEILNGRWRHSDGALAPVFSKLQVIGAFINDRNDVWIAHRKRFRSDEIHNQGWS
jgi:hypothetical protein